MSGEVGAVLDHRLIFVVGVAHSGTTVMYRLLARHPDLGWFSQFSRRDGTVPGRFRLPFGGLYNRVMRRLLGAPWRKRRGWDEYVVPRPMEANATWDYLLPPRGHEMTSDPDFYRVGDITDDMIERFDRVLGEELTAWRRDRLICKLPRLSQAADLLADLLPAARFVHVVRDGRAVSLSNRGKFSRRIPDPKRALRTSARHWKAVVSDLVRTVEPSLPAARWHTVHLEELQADPGGVLSDVLGFLDLSGAAYPTPVPDLREDTNAKWRRRATDRDVTLLNEELGDLLEELGYPERWGDRQSRAV